MRSLLHRYGLYFAWLVSLVATGGSLYFSEVRGFIPCKLCWWQRIFMYPQALLLGMAAYRDDRAIVPYLLPLNLAGASLSLFHYLQEKVPALRVPVCAADIPCTTPWIDWFGFITIPFLALSAFVLMTFFLWQVAPRAPAWEPPKTP